MLRIVVNRPSSVREFVHVLPPFRWVNCKNCRVAAPAPSRIMAAPLFACAVVFRLFRPKPAPAIQPPSSAGSDEFRGATTAGYHFALRLQRDAQQQPQRLIGWHGSASGGARVELQRGADGLWRDVHGRQAAAFEALLPDPIRLSAAWAAQRPQAANAGGPDHPAAAGVLPALDQA